ncbi:MAG TPA: hypothetical protein VF624_14300 [Tepidisphaeraceae bacterium]|jgi:hypothetical protein
MPDDLEQIEARLAAYIDDALPEPARTEIEQYLAGNPAHRQLVEELRMQRARLADLPRESAPAEVMDHLQGHLERQTLLENVDQAASSMKINRWPQWTAIAAVLVLTAGLGLLIYQVLPKTNNDAIVLAPPSMGGPEAAAVPDLARTAGEQKFLEEAASDLRQPERRRDDRAKYETTPPSAALPPLPPGNAMPPVVTAPPPADAGAMDGEKPKDAGETETAARRDAVAAIEGQLQSVRPPPTGPSPVDPAAGPLPGAAAPPAEVALAKPATDGFPAAGSDAALHKSGAIATLIVNTDDPRLTESLIAGYLAQNAIPFRASEVSENPFADNANARSNAGVVGTEKNTATTGVPSAQEPQQAQQQISGEIVQRRMESDADRQSDNAQQRTGNAYPSNAYPSNSNLSDAQRAASPQAGAADAPREAVLLIDDLGVDQIDALSAVISSQRGYLQDVVRVEAGGGAGAAATKQIAENAAGKTSEQSGANSAGNDPTVSPPETVTPSTPLAPLAPSTQPGPLAAQGRSSPEESPARPDAVAPAAAPTTLPSTTTRPAVAGAAQPATGPAATAVPPATAVRRSKVAIRIRPRPPAVVEPPLPPPAFTPVAPAAPAATRPASQPAS